MKGWEDEQLKQIVGWVGQDDEYGEKRGDNGGGDDNGRRKGSIWHYGAVLAH